MLHFTMNMPFLLMAFYGSLMIVIVLLFRGLLKDRLPKFVFPVLWCVVLLRLLVPFSLSSPLTIKAVANIPWFILPGFIGIMSENVDMSENIDTSENAVTQDSAAEAVDGMLFTDMGKGETPRVQTETAIVEGTYASYGEAYGGDFVRKLFREDFWLLISVLYYGGILVTLAVFALQKYGYTKKLKNCLLIEHNETINTMLREMDMGHILVFTNDEIASPLVCGMFSPKIYLPTRMDFQNVEMLRHIFTHETMHIKRKDNWVKLVMLAALVLHWFNPLVWIMCKCLSSDLEAACDEAVLRQYGDEEERKRYAFSLLGMAVSGNRTTMLYSAFSKTEVEKRIKSILHYKKAPAFVIAVSVLFLICSTTVFATGVQAPFSDYLTSYCSSSNSRWGVQVELTRNIALGKNPQKRAEDVVFDILREDTTNDPELIEGKIRDALAEEFHVEKSAFRFRIGLVFTEEERKAEWEAWGLTEDEHGYFLYLGEPVRVMVDEKGGFYMSREEGSVDITVERSRYGEIMEVVALREGDSEFDRRSEEIEREQSRRRAAPGMWDGSAETTVIENTAVEEY